ncbi:diguanylate cyclase (GGDEF)-like protein/PAS domain S-box-containing protein [Methylobacterium sp. BE186]|uniref:putative bifunctional diguanylate cyclase/phosphodiesterase n=1 Tax=Methylobacterium sp. BE186 TaxID=2817715 RepID=UPI00285E44AD|nr:EAL domain-containing protein [Methylobacterium sp. BE186]MDR7035741.1 diguanylate cyclase (GGDEF)-like protein/PAS domain S-box-containing protein [Methylobacterium sp. BE186]
MPLQLLEDYAQVASDWFWETGADACFTYLSPGIGRFLGRDVAELMGRSRHAISVNGEDENHWRPYREAMARREGFRDFDYPYSHPDGGTRWLRISGEPRFGRDGAFEGYRGVGTDVSAERAARSALSTALGDLRASNLRLAEQNRLFEAALSNMVQGLCMFDAAARLVVCNHRYREIFGLPPEAVQFGMSQRDLCTILVARGCYRREVTVDSLCEGTRLAITADEAAPIHRELADGRILAVCYRPIEGGGWVSTFEDITERRRNEARIAHMARHDALTDLPNRTALRECGTDLMAEGRHEGGQRLAMLALDLDRFKVVNDTHGHGVGDALLRAVAERLCANVRGGDLVARLGGDEFAVMHRVADAQGALTLAERLIAVVSAPYELGDYSVEIGMSVGLALAGAETEDVERLLKNADTALYHAKGAGRGQACLFAAAMDETAEARRTLERDLRAALVSDAFELHYQPLVEAGSGGVRTLEALMRWRHPEQGLISPATFIPIAEETGLIVPLGEWVLNQACRDAATWPAEVGLAVNVSAVQLRHRAFAQTVLLALAASGLRPERLELEITESVLLDDTEANLETLHLLRRTGIRISMDDFGTGYSSLSYLRRFPFDKIKIDRSFVRDAGHLAESGPIIRALVGLGANLGITTVIEGIETPDQLAAVRAEGCDEIQGFLFSPPRPAREVGEMLAGLRRRAAQEAAQEGAQEAAQEAAAA